MLESAQGWRTRQRCDTIDRRLQCQVVPQLAMVVEILIAQRQAVQTLTQLGQRAVPAASRVARIPQHAGRCRAQSEAAVGGTQQQHATVAAHRAARKINLNRALATGWKAKIPPLDFA